MPERSRLSTVTFQSPFSLSDLEGPQAAGTYTVETVDTTLDNLSFLAWRRISTLIRLPAIGVASAQKQMIAIDPLELAAALKRDAGSQPETADGKATAVDAAQR